MADSTGLVVEVIEDRIIVTLPGTLFLAAYRKRHDMAALAAHFLQDDRHAPLPRSTLVVRSWRLALPRRKSSAGSPKRRKLAVFSLRL